MVTTLGGVTQQCLRGAGGTLPAIPSRTLLLRTGLFVAGSTIVTLCYALTIQAALGLGPLFVVQQGLARTAGMSIGEAVIVTGLAMVVIAVCLRSFPGPGTLLLPIIGGVTLDAALPYVPSVHGVALRVVVVVLATWFMALGGVCVIRADVGVAAYDAVMLGFMRITRRPAGPIRVIMELTMLGCGWLLGGTVGLGTAITGLLIGPGLQFWLRVVRVPVATRLQVES